MRGKKFLAITLAAMMATGIAGCNRDMNSNNEQIQDFSEIEKNEQNIIIGGLIAPPPANYHHYADGSTNENFITPERYLEIKECGLDFVEGHAEKGLTPEMYDALNSAAEAGIGYMINYNITNQADKSETLLRQTWGEIFSHDGCFGIFMRDEPPATEYNLLGKTYDKFSQITDKFLEINLLPYDPTVNYNNSKTDETLNYGLAAYDKYVEDFCKKVDSDYISVDIYPFYENELAAGVMGYSMYEYWLLNLETVMNIAAREGRSHWECLQGQKVHGFSKKPDYNDIRMQVYTSMAYGASAFQYYCYWTPEEVERPCLIDKEGNRTSIWYDAQKINLEVKNFGNVFTHFASGWKGVMPLGECVQFTHLRTPVESYPRISSAVSSEEAIVGIFNDGEGRDAFMVTNFTVPGEKIDNTVTLTFNDATSAICYIAGEKTVKQLENGTLTLNLGPGEGVFVIPEK